VLPLGIVSLGVFSIDIRIISYILNVVTRCGETHVARTVKSAQAISAAWLASMQGGKAAANYTAGVNAVTQSPTAAAATPAALAAYQEGVALSVSSGRRAAALNAVSLQSWQQVTTTKGAPRLSSGAVAAAPKQAAAMQKWQPVYQQASDAAQAIAKVPGTSNLGRVDAAVSVLLKAAGK
jgi:hypothetical protein